MTAIPLQIRSFIQRHHQVLAMAGILTALAAITVWIYWPVWRFEFVNWDDPWYILNNPLIQSWSFENVKSIATESVIRNYAPITMFSYLIDYSLFGEWAGGYHLVNLFWHTANVLLVFVLLKQVTGRRALAAATAVLFAVHPVHVESVAWVSSRKGLISGAFILASLICWLRKERTPKNELWGIFFLLLALLSKAIAVVVPGIVFCYDLFVRKDRFADAIARQIVPGFLAVWLLVKTMAAQVTMLGGVRGHYELSKLEILAVDMVILWRYVGMLLWPRDLSVLYDPPTSGIWPLVLLAAMAWGLVGWWIWKQRERQPLILLAAAAWILLLLPVLNLFPITTLMNDRYLYLPSIPALAMFVAGVGWLAQEIGKRTVRQVGWVITASLFILATIGLMERTTEYLPVWENDIALWEHAVEQTPDLAVVQYQRATSLYNAGDRKAALRTLDYAIEHCHPDKWDRGRFLKKQAEWSATD